MRDAGSDRRWRVDEARYVCRGAIIERHRRPEANGLRMRAYRHDRHLSSSTERLAVRRQHDDRRVGGPAGERQLDRRHDRGACLVAPHEHRLLRRTPYDTTATWEDASTRVCLFTAMTITTQPPARCVSIHNHRGTTSRRRSIRRAGARTPLDLYRARYLHHDATTRSSWCIRRAIRSAL